MRDMQIAFLGQCHTTGYPGVAPTEIFPQVARRSVQAARPDVAVRIATANYYHPADLAQVARASLGAQPDVLVIEVVGFLAARGHQSADLSRLPAAVRSACDRARHFRILTAKIRHRWPAGAGLVARVEAAALALAARPVRALVPRLARPTVADYEACLDRTLDAVRQAGRTRVVLQGPGVFSEDLDPSQMASDSPEIYRRVNAMAREVANRHTALFVDRFDDGLISARTFYEPGSIRPSARGHEAWGQLLAEKLLQAGFV